jgi:hypothetical protein
MSLRLRLMTAVTVCACAIALTSVPETALAVPRSPGWSIHSVAQPTNFSAADSRDTRETVIVNATGGSYELEVRVEGIGSEFTPPIAWNESAEGLQQKLESMANVGAGNVKVTGGPGGSQPYTVEFDGALSGNSTSMFVGGEEHNHLTGGAATVEAQPNQNGEAMDRYQLIAVNAGSRSSEGEVVITDKLPAGVVATEAEVREPRTNHKGECTLQPLRCIYNGEPIQPEGDLVVALHVAVISPSTTGPLTNEATVSGGGGAAASVSEPNPVNVGPAAFGIEQVAFEALGPDGAPDAQAGDHPYAVTTTIDLNTVLHPGIPHITRFLPAQEVRNIVVELPLGFVGDPLAAERCPEVDLTVTFGKRTACPEGSIVGSIEVVLERGTRSTVAVYNIAPERGYPAEFGFNAGIGQPIMLYTSIVPTTEGYRLRVAVPGALRGFLEGSSLTIFGDPGEHNGTGDRAAFVTNPTACSSTPLKMRVEATSWEGGSDAREATAYPQVSGCNLLQGASLFNPQLEVQPEQTQADTPAGYEVDLKVPQAASALGALATPELKDASVTLPAGVSLSPAVASGAASLEACTPAQIDLLGTELGEGHPGGNGSPYDDGLTHASPGHCPEGSRVGEVEVTTPLLEETLKGHVYIAQPSCGGTGQPECTSASAEDGELYGIYMELAGSGVILKLHGKVSVNSQTGQITTSFTENPQLPFEELKLKLYGGQRSALANPQTCGTATTTSDLEPWSAPESGPNATPSWPFAVTGCAGPMPFAPSFSAGTEQTLAGAFSPFTMTLSRKDGEQDLGGVSLTMPPGVAGILAKVPLCGEPLAREGKCPEASKIGTVNAAAGAGSEPLWLPGRVYLTGPYKGAPFGLSVVVPAVAGPFNLGNVVERAAISVNPTTAQVTVTSGALQQSRDGVPFRLKTLNVTIDRPEFIYNPTNCSQMPITGTVSGDLPNGAPGSTVGVSSPFAVAGCANLPFKPKFTVSTSGHTSRADGASLDAKVVYPAGSLGTEANIAKAKVDLPKQLPSRLTTLQKACTAAVFEANPASCPAASVVGHATAVTPVLPVPLMGPAYFVSHGGAKFPELIVVLQGYGVTVDLNGETFISKGITSSTFRTVPDVPISSFELILPEGRYSALTANGNLCKSKLVMPTAFVAQNGAEIHESTPISVSGCKPAITVVRHSVNGKTATIAVSVPAAGKLVATGKGLSRATGKAGGAGTVTVKMTLSSNEQAFLAKHPGRKLKASVKLTFTPKKGAKLKTTTTVLI